MLGVNKVLVESYRLIYRFIHHGGKIWMNSAIQKRVRWLYRNFGITRWEIIAYEPYEKAGIQTPIDKHRWPWKFDPKKSCLETYVLNFTYFTLLTLVRRFKKQETGGEKEIPFSQLVDFEPIKTIGHSIDWPFERQGIEGLIDEENPEDILMGGELMEMPGLLASSHFGNSDNWPSSSG